MDAGRRNNRESRMKYNIGDLVRIKYERSDLRTDLGLIIGSTTLFQQPLYEMVICGNEGKVYYVYEHNVVEKVE